MNVYEQALLFNNHGVALLASGSNEQREAIAKFRCALAVIKAGIIDESQKVADKHSSSSNNQSSTTTMHSSSSASRRGEERPRPASSTPRTASSSCYCTHNKNVDDDDENDDCEQLARNSNIQLNIQDFLEPIVVPFPEMCNSGGDDGDFFLYRHAFIVSRSSSFSPSWENSQDKVAADDDDDHDATNLLPRKRSYPGTTTSTRSSPHTEQISKPPPLLPTNSTPHLDSSPTNKSIRLTSKNLRTQVREHQEPCGSYHPLSLDLLSSVVVFNMALAHNLEEASQHYKLAMGLEHHHATTSTEKLNLSALNEVSRRLYDMSIGLLGNVLRTESTASKPVIEAMAVLAASSNNLAKILLDQDKIQTARSTLKTLWHTTSWICEKVLLPQQEGKTSAPSLFAHHHHHHQQQQQQQQRSMAMSHVMPRADTATTEQPQNQPWSSNNNMAARGTSRTRSNERTTFDEMDGNFLARTPARGERTNTAAASFLFSETDMEGFIMNVMLMYHSQPPIAAKAA